MTTPSRPVLAVGAVIFVGEGVVLVKRGKAPMEGCWTLPGGTVELAERVAPAVAREVAEETGLVVTAGPLVEVVEHVSFAADGSVAFHYVILDYLCEAVGGRLTASSDALDVASVPESAFDRYDVDSETRRVVALGRRLAAEPRAATPRLTPGTKPT